MPTIGTPCSEPRGCRSGQPRERRLKFAIPVTFRSEGSREWLTGRTLNLSRSGLLLEAEQFLGVDSRVEFVLDMPVEIAGQNGGRVLCQGRVARAVKDKGSEAWLLAFAIIEYEFLRENAVGI